MQFAEFAVHVHVVGWRPGFQKVKHTRAVQRIGGLSLSEAKAGTDSVLAGNSFSLRLPTVAAAEQLARELEQLGAIVQVEPEHRET